MIIFDFTKNLNTNSNCDNLTKFSRLEKVCEEYKKYL
jgi:hypothetical protein